MHLCVAILVASSALLFQFYNSLSEMSPSELYTVFQMRPHLYKCIIIHGCFIFSLLSNNSSSTRTAFLLMYAQQFSLRQISFLKSSGEAGIYFHLSPPNCASLHIYFHNFIYPFTFALSHCLLPSPFAKFLHTARWVPSDHHPRCLSQVDPRPSWWAMAW